MAPQPLHVEGLADLRRAFAVADKELSKELRLSLREVAKPVQHDAERLAAAGIRRIGLPWSRMRIGVTRSSVYVAPKQRGVKSRGRGNLRRPNLFDLLMERSLEPALAQNERRIVSEMGDMLATVGKKWERV